MCGSDRLVMDGMTSTRAIREHEDMNNIERCRIVALTGLASASARLEALSSGVDHFMTKPLNFKALGALLRKEEERKILEKEARALKEIGEEKKVDKENTRQHETEKTNITWGKSGQD